MLTPARRCARRLVRDACAVPSRPPLEPGTQQRAALSPHTRSCGVHLASGHRASRCPVSLHFRELLRGDSVYQTRPRTRGMLVSLWSADAAAAAIVEARAYRARGLPQGPEAPVPLDYVEPVVVADIAQDGLRLSSWVAGVRVLTGEPLPTGCWRSAPDTWAVTSPVSCVSGTLCMRLKAPSLKG